MKSTRQLYFGMRRKHKHFEDLWVAKSAQEIIIATLWARWNSVIRRQRTIRSSGYPSIYCTCIHIYVFLRLAWSGIVVEYKYIHVYINIAHLPMWKSSWDTIRHWLIFFTLIAPLAVDAIGPLEKKGLMMESMERERERRQGKEEIDGLRRD